MLVEDVIDGAAFTAISAMFSNKPSFISTASFFQSASSGSSTKGLEFGEAICDAVIEEFKSDGFAPLGAPLSGKSDCIHSWTTSIDFNDVESSW